MIPANPSGSRPICIGVVTETFLVGVCHLVSVLVLLLILHYIATHVYNLLPVVNCEIGYCDSQSS